MSERFVFPDEIATDFRVTEETAKRWIRTGRFGTPFKAGRPWVVTREDFDAAIEQKKCIDGNHPAA